MLPEPIRNLALLTPPDNLYKDISNDRLYQMAMEEADEGESREQVAFKQLQDSGRADWLSGMADGNRRFLRFKFWSEFRECCLNQIVYLRAELIKRIGPTAIDQEEMRLFNGSNSLTNQKDPENTSISAVISYIPKFRRLAQKLKDKKEN